MKKLLLLAITLIAFSSFSQQYKENFNVKFDVNKELFPEYLKEDNMHMSSQAGAMVAAAYIERPYNTVEELRAELEMEIGTTLTPLSIDTTALNRKAVTGFTATADDENGVKKVFEVYLVEVNKGNGIIIVMSGYKLSDKAIYGLEGKKAALSAMVIQ